MTDQEKCELLPDFLKPIAKMLLAKEFPALPESPLYGTWYKYRADKACCGNGEPYAACLKIGRENKLIVVFCGGGVSINAYTAAHPNNPLYPDPINFYADDAFLQTEFIPGHGLGKNDACNPFRDWSVLVIPYATGDFHTGTNDFRFKTEKGEERVLHHKGYDNYRILIDKVKEFVPAPEKLLVTGFSAGGFATALLTDDLIKVFPACNDVTCFPDAALLRYSGWRETAEKCWGAPDEIAARLVSDDIVLDQLTALHKNHGDRVKIIYCCSHRDALLAQYQHFLDRGDMRGADSADGDRFHDMLKDFCEKLIAEIPDVGTFIYDAPHEENQPNDLTKHGINMTDMVFTFQQDGIACIDWIYDAVCGDCKKIGLKLLGL